MPYLLIRHKVKDYGQWRPVYDDHAATRAANGCIADHVFRDPADPNQVVMLFQWDTFDRAKKFVNSDDLRNKMREAGVIGKPEAEFLNREAGVETIARVIYDCFNSNDMNKALSVISDRCEWVYRTNGMVGRGKEGFRQIEDNWLTAFPDGKIEITNLRVSAPWVTVQYIGRGTHTGVLNGPSGAIQPTGRKVELQLCDILRIEGGLIVHGETYYDNASLLSQLGLVAPPAAKAA